MKQITKISGAVTAMLFAAITVWAQQEIVVAQDGSGSFKSIQEAVNSLPADAKEQRIIHIKPGTYREKVFIDKHFITLKGDDPAKTIITISLSRDEWRCENPDDYGTATLNLKGSDIVLENLSFINSYGKDNTKDKTISCSNDAEKTKNIRPVSHQMALRSFATTRLIVQNCIFRAYGGDTVSPWNTEDGMFYFKDCIMEGGVDFYCPRGWAYAENCTFICHNNEAAIWHDGSKNQDAKTVLVNCTFTGDPGYGLGRYHRDAQFYLISCRFDKNMADADIFQREANPPNTLQWGRRVYYYNCSRKAGNYKWFADNLPVGVNSKAINAVWTFGNRWNPADDEIREDVSIAINPQVTEPGKNSAAATDAIAENMLLYQRSNGGWGKNVDYKKTLTDEDRKKIHSGYEAGKDATIDNGATTKEIKYLVQVYKTTKNESYIQAAQRGIDYLLKAQYANGGWPQFYPDFSGYRSQVTYNDNAMVNVLNVLYDVVYRINNMELLDPAYAGKCVDAVAKAVPCILKTQLKQKGKLTAWCAQYNAQTLQPEMARKFELVSLSGSESVGIVRFLMRIEKPSPAIIASVKAAVEWFGKVKITGYDWVEVAAPAEKSGRDKILQPDPTGVLWARFYDIETNEPFFSGRDSERKKTLAEIENERRVGYAWYGTWAAKLLSTEYPAWKLKWGIQD